MSVPSCPGRFSSSAAELPAVLGSISFQARQQPWRGCCDRLTCSRRKLTGVKPPPPLHQLSRRNSLSLPGRKTRLLVCVPRRLDGPAKTLGHTCCSDTDSSTWRQALGSTAPSVFIASKAKKREKNTLDNQSSRRTVTRRSRADLYDPLVPIEMASGTSVGKLDSWLSWWCYRHPACPLVVAGPPAARSTVSLCPAPNTACAAHTQQDPKQKRTHITTPQTQRPQTQQIARTMPAEQ